MPTGDYLLYMRIDYAINNHHGPVGQGLPLPENFESSRQGVSNGHRVRILSRSLDRQSQSLRPRLVEDRDDVSGLSYIYGFPVDVPIGLSIGTA